MQGGQGYNQKTSESVAMCATRFRALGRWKEDTNAYLFRDGPQAGIRDFGQAGKEAA